MVRTPVGWVRTLDLGLGALGMGGGRRVGIAAAAGSVISAYTAGLDPNSAHELNGYDSDDDTDIVRIDVRSGSEEWLTPTGVDTYNTGDRGSRLRDARLRTCVASTGSLRPAESGWGG
jgi:hypothetical protein